MNSTQEKTPGSQPVDAPTSGALHKDGGVATPPSSDSSVVERDGNGHAARAANGEKHDGGNVPTDVTAAPGEQPQRSKLKIGLIMASLAVAVLLV
jgi:hypothetical protein